VPKKVLSFAGISDVYTSSSGHTKTAGNFVRAAYRALEKTYGFLTPDLWAASAYKPTPYQEFTGFLAEKEVVKPKEDRRERRPRRDNREGRENRERR
jgi:small subunit ribosomal protein S2e